MNIYINPNGRKKLKGTNIFIYIDFRDKAKG